MKPSLLGFGLFLVSALPAAAGVVRLEPGTGAGVARFFNPSNASPSVAELAPLAQALSSLTPADLDALDDESRLEAEQALGVIRGQLEALPEAVRRRSAGGDDLEDAPALAARLQGLSLLSQSVKLLELSPSRKSSLLEALFEARRQAGAATAAPILRADAGPLDAHDARTVSETLDVLRRYRLRFGSPADAVLRRRADGLIAAGRVLLGEAPSSVLEKHPALPPIRGVEDWYREVVLLRSHSKTRLASVLATRKAMSDAEAFEELERPFMPQLHLTEQVGPRLEPYTRRHGVYPLSRWGEAIARGRVPAGVSARLAQWKDVEQAGHDVDAHYFALGWTLYQAAARYLARELFLRPAVEAGLDAPLLDEDTARDAVSARRASETFAHAQWLFTFQRNVSRAALSLFPAKQARGFLTRLYTNKENLAMDVDFHVLHWRDAALKVLREPGMNAERFLAWARESYRSVPQPASGPAERGEVFAQALALSFYP